MDPRPEKPNHQHYLNEFRVEACPLFKQHQCQQHRPYTCFNWHFANQRRRRPVRKADGSFNYSPDIYCDKYDENTGICPDGDSCAYLHRVSGDVERKYHLRYYKTAQCVHPTDSRGQCVKNGAHCAFAHSSADLRQPQHDTNDGVYAASLQDGESRDRTSFVIEDPQWHSQDHVLSCYKTEQCRKPARLCRQGYACPFYHNSKDRRRPPATFKYRSTPCPAAKTVDEWLDPELCEAGDLCGYCHTRTEQQFHPEIYKSTKCNDMLEHGYCPRAVFCAFAHHDSEMHIQRTPYASSSQTSPKEQHSPAQSVSDIMRFGSPGTNGLGGANFAQMQAMMAKSRAIPKQYSSREDLISSSYPKAPGFERGPLSPNRADNNMGRLRTHSLNMGHLDMASRQSMIAGTPLSLFEERPMASSFHQIPTLDELNLDLAPIEEQPSGRRETFSGVSSVGDVFGNAVSAPMRIPGSDSFHTSPMSYSESMFANKMNAAPFVPYQPPPSVSVPGDGAEEELARTRSELAQHHHKLAVWQDGIKQARQACEAWKADAEHYKLRAEKAEMERNVAIYERDQLRAQLATLQGGNGGNGNSGSAAAVSQPVPVGGEAAAAVAASSPLYSTHPSSDFVESMMRAATLASSPPYQSLFGDDAPPQPQSPACARCGRAGRPASDGGCSLCSV